VDYEAQIRMVELLKNGKTLGKTQLRLIEIIFQQGLAGTE
jgi:hypothetical protein